MHYHLSQQIHSKKLINMMYKVKMIMKQIILKHQNGLIWEKD